MSMPSVLETLCCIAERAFVLHSASRCRTESLAPQLGHTGVPVLKRLYLTRGANAVWLLRNLMIVVVSSRDRSVVCGHRVVIDGFLRL